MKWVTASLAMAMVCGSGCSTVKGWLGYGKNEEEEKMVHTIPSPRYEVILDEAVAGDERAQYSLGEMYRRGDGVGQNFAEAYAWYSIAAQNGHLGARAQIRAGWKATNIARGKELMEILKERYPDAVISCP